MIRPRVLSQFTRQARRERDGSPLDEHAVRGVRARLHAASARVHRGAGDGGVGAARSASRLVGAEAHSLSLRLLERDF